MTRVRDVYLLKKSATPGSGGNPFDKHSHYVVLKKALFCRVNDLGLQKQTLLFGGDSLYQDAKTVIVNGSPPLPDKIAFVDEYDPKTEKGILYDVRMPRSHTNSVAFFVFNTKSKVG
ncbi:hypothetical protein [Limosilactobacillus vaginalis]|uniref:hypothetical protein n=1 Tax=Limosilactobacillus vaginalis TaxID=1633 RepID=UPI003735C152|nr:hypothetical protein [Lactobacillus sp.]